MRHQAFARLGERVLHAGRYLGIELPADQVQLLQAFERLRQHLLRTIGHIATKAVEPHRPVQIEVVQDQKRPFVAEFLDYITDGTLQIVGVNRLVDFSHAAKVQKFPKETKYSKKIIFFHNYKHLKTSN